VRYSAVKGRPSLAVRPRKRKVHVSARGSGVARRTHSSARPHMQGTGQWRGQRTPPR